MACCGDIGWPVLHRLAELRYALASAGKDKPFRIVYQPLGGDPVAHFEHVGWLCVHAENCTLVCDEVDMVCSAGSPKNAQSEYWKNSSRGPALEKIVQYGRHSHVAFVGIARAPQDVWRRLTANAQRIIVYRMNERLELDAVRNRLESATDELPRLGKYEYVDWHDDGTAVVVKGTHWKPK